MSFHQSFVLFDNACHLQAFVLQELVYQDMLSTQQVDCLDQYLQRGWAKGLFCAVFADYEWGLSFQKLSGSFSGSLRIMWFRQKIFVDADDWLQQHASSTPAGVSEWTCDISQQDYAKHVSHIQAAIERGDCYQINYTVRLKGQTYGDPIRLYQRLRQNVPYGVLAKLAGNQWVLCFSPELFLRIEASGRITSEPMKGTAPILNDGYDAARALALQHDPKNRAENTMIVDLLRNDLGKLAVTGGVSVPNPFCVQAFGQVWQMTSQVVAQLPACTTVAQLFQAAFPCGSITGAPKRKSMQYINELEDTPRGLYTGSIGFLEHEPNSALGFSGCLNVVIRTLQLEAITHEFFHGQYGVGSGIVIDSDADSEYAECGWKARFLTELRPEFGLFETMRVENGQVAYWSQHFARLSHSAGALNIPFDAETVKNKLVGILSQLSKQQTYRLKLKLTADGAVEIEYAPLLPLNDGLQKIVLSPDVLPRHDVIRRHKTTHRLRFDQAWQSAISQGAFDALLFNEDGFLLEGGRSSVVVLFNNQWLTPAPELDILPSIALSQLSGSLTPKPAYITRAMLQQAEKIRVGNALHGWFDVVLQENKVA